MNSQTEGSAFGTSMKPGQVLFSVDGKDLDGHTHEDIARLIVDSYMDMTKNTIEFVVVETKSSFLLNQQQVLHHKHPLSFTILSYLMK
jgi:hypothetical protein